MCAGNGFGFCNQNRISLHLAFRSCAAAAGTASTAAASIVPVAVLGMVLVTVLAGAYLPP